MGRRWDRVGLVLIHIPFYHFILSPHPMLPPTASPEDELNHHCRISKDKISGHSIKLPSITNNMIPSMSVMGFGSSSTSSSATAPSPSHTLSTGNTAGTGGEKVLTPDEVHTKACAAILRVLKRILLVESENERAISGGQ